MRRALIAAAGLLLVAGTGVAVADSIGTRSVKPAVGTVGVSSTVLKKLRTCTGTDGTVAEARIEARGTASSSEQSLSGPVKVDLAGVVDTSKNAGTFSGSVRIEIQGAHDTLGRLTGVYANGKLHGLLQGTAARPYQRVVANVSADLNPTTGALSNLKIGQTDAGGAAVLIQPGTCRPVPTIKQRVEVTGLVSAVSNDTITVASVTCWFPRNSKPLSGLPTVVKAGDPVQMACVMADQRLVVEKLKILR